MKHQKLHDLAKFAAGLILGDFIYWCWLASTSTLPASFAGIRIMPSMVVPGMIFDVALFVILVHYGWHLGRTPMLRSRTYFVTVGVILGVVALAHLLRLFAAVDLVLAGWTVPLWISWIGVAVAAYLSYMSFRLGISGVRK